MPTLPTFTALKYRNYRLWFSGQVISLFGTWMQQTAQGFLVYELTRSPAYLGYVGFANGAPTWLFMLYGGVIADRLPRRTLLIITQTTMMILAFILAALTFTSMVQPWHILILSLLLGVANAFDAPARLAIVVELVDREDLTNAIALNSTMFNLASAIGPAVAGITYAAFGPEWCFMLNGLTFLAIIFALFMMRLSPVQKSSQQTSAIKALREGLRYTFSQRIILTLIGVIAFTSVFGISFGNLLPAWAVDVLRGDAKTNGWLRSAQGLGALASALTIASLGHFKFRGKLLTVGMFAFPLFMFLITLSRQTNVTLLLMIGVGFASILIMNLANALVQSYVADELRGRVMSIYSLAFFGLGPIGSLIIGGVAERTNEVSAVLINTAVLLVFALFIWIAVPRLRNLT